jgi:hypothetical protein
MTMTLRIQLSASPSLSRFVVPFDRSLRENDWRLHYQPNPSMLPEGKTALRPVMFF